MGCKLLAALSAFSVVSAFAAPTMYEAEDLPGASVAEGAEFSGGKYAKTADPSGITFTVKVEETAVYDITTKVLIKQYDWTTSKIAVNGVDVGSMLTTPRNCDSSYVVSASAKMKAGENKITVGNQALGVDYITVERHPDPTFNIGTAPVTPNASESAKKLYSFLRENFGKKTVSGMMISDQNFNYDYGNMRLIPPGGCTPADSCKFSDEEVSWKGQTDIAEFYKRSGHYPAIGGFDMLFAAGGHHEEGWFKGYTENNLLMTEDLWNMGGIPTYTWHWKVGEDTVFYTQGTPAGFNNPGCTEGVMGTSNTNTCFNYTKAFKGDKCQEIDETSQEYKDIVADVDIVSGYFKQLQDKGIAVVWRPLHEASGGWFWWGVASAECYVQLYRLVFDRMVKTNKLTNLIWVWNINTDPKFGYDYSALNAAWYPGDAYVDIVAVDIYDPLNDHNSAANYYNKIVSDVGTSKMIALSENGAIPDIDSIAEDKAYWSYWMTWSQTWSGNFLEKTPADMWKRNLDDERIIALDDMPGWDNVNAGTTPIRSVITNKLNIALQGNNLSITVPQAGHTSIALFDMLGHKVVSLAKGNLPAGSLQFSLDGIARGNYIVRAKNGTMNYAQRIQVK
ncbi:mannan endo-1,4-beta-mannosidase [Fibrobacter sp. UWB15]|uniref:glycosyl hydrolase n=1 Tax=unclassified Fibrobacter TaxID=2634177 RepID=UPI0009215193|nr:MULTISPECIES: glycosyl hydrolase [unclassified Fibrobacter]PWJ62384.1 mannan endo-1,4-beta-mannosidase [Fibrobacter sp. UWB6]SHG50927.1 mannan endo-1,4-beta-mannosidase [Fibrobacter sp. UWB8]SMG40753.1 mannan endo-1,4-beta-mannosidase [Fibrobacter sp. UWB15]